MKTYFQEHFLSFSFFDLVVDAKTDFKADAKSARLEEYIKAQKLEVILWHFSVKPGKTEDATQTVIGLSFLK